MDQQGRVAGKLEAPLAMDYLLILCWFRSWNRNTEGRSLARGVNSPRAFYATIALFCLLNCACVVYSLFLRPLPSRQCGQFGQFIKYIIHPEVQGGTDTEYM